ncbi:MULTISPECIES: gamma-glutamylcyclotransferase [unclassified Pseudonocardia]|uniref:allophanate hydrolase-related protein n=1 Tax=unclassified Pseudonocardia TaxID=2619320 RepID=UPI00094AFE76|nr:MULTISPECIES: gamma-glutamylcyclotransferase [unclassified Pseudonocardia]
MSDSVRMFVNGQAMSGGPLHDALAGARFLGPVRTAPDYRFFSFDDVFPGIAPVPDGGWSVPGEIYEISYTQLRRDLLPREPAELELSVIELEDGTGSLSMVCRTLPGATDAVEITAAGGWREHLGAVSTAR